MNPWISRYTSSLASCVYEHNDDKYNNDYISHPSEWYRNIGYLTTIQDFNDAAKKSYVARGFPPDLTLKSAPVSTLLHSGIKIDNIHDLLKCVLW